MSSVLLDDVRSVTDPNARFFLCSPLSGTVFMIQFFYVITLRMWFLHLVSLGYSLRIGLFLSSCDMVYDQLIGQPTGVMMINICLYNVAGPNRTLPIL